jgi:hypothetical protein
MLIDLTEERAILPSLHLSTYMSWTAWKALEDGWDRRSVIAEVLHWYMEALAFSPPSVEILFPLHSAKQLKAVYGPNRHFGCVVIMLRSESGWLMPQFPLGRIAVSETARKELLPEFLNAGLARHVAGDQGEPTRWRDENAGDGGSIVSSYEHPHVGELEYTIETMPDRSVTKVWTSWEDGYEESSEIAF